MHLLHHMFRMITQPHKTFLYNLVQGRVQFKVLLYITSTLTMLYVHMKTKKRIWLLVCLFHSAYQMRQQIESKEMRLLLQVILMTQKASMPMILEYFPGVQKSFSYASIYWFKSSLISV